MLGGSLVSIISALLPLLVLIWLQNQLDFYVRNCGLANSYLLVMTIAMSCWLPHNITIHIASSAPGGGSVTVHQYTV